MILNIRNNVTKRPASFLSTNLTPNNQCKTTQIDNEIEDDPIFYIAESIKKKLTKTPRKQVRLIDKKQSNKLIRVEKQASTNYDQTLPVQSKILPDNNLKKLSRKINLNLSDTLEKQRKLLSQVTIHRIRSQRQSVQTQTKRLENSYNYLLQKFEKSRKKSLQTRQKQRRHKSIQEQNKKVKQELQIERRSLMEQNFLEKSRLREAVLLQKKQKQRTLRNFYSSLQANASEVRLQSNKMDEQIIQSQLKQIESKKIKYATEKEKQKKRLLQKQQGFQTKRFMAQNQFKQKWLKQFSEHSKARKLYLTKKQLLTKKMHLLFKQFENPESSCESIEQFTPKHNKPLHSKLAFFQQ